MAGIVLICCVPATVGILAPILSIPAIVMGSIWLNKCEIAPVISSTGEIVKTSTTLLGSWLIAYGVGFLVLCALYIAFKIPWVNISAEHDYDYSSKVGQLPKLRAAFSAVLLVLSICSIAWIAYGGWMLFNENGKICKNSIHPDGLHLYRATLAYWILMLIGIVGLILLWLDAWMLSEDPP